MKGVGSFLDRCDVFVLLRRPIKKNRVSSWITIDVHFMSTIFDGLAAM
jgi:hypothetical protein